MEGLNMEKVTEKLPTDYCLMAIKTIGVLENDEILQVGIMKIRKNNLIEKYVIYIKPTKEIDRQVARAIKITNEDLKYADSIDKAIPKILNIIENDTIILYSNELKLDLLKSNCEKLGLEIKNEAINGIEIINQVQKEIKAIICNATQILLEM